MNKDVILITGSNGEMGKALIRRLIKNKSNIIITLDINESSLNEYELDLTGKSWSTQNQNSIGSVLKKKNLKQLGKEIDELKENEAFFESINKTKIKYLYGEGSSAKKIVEYIMASR